MIDALFAFNVVADTNPSVLVPATVNVPFDVSDDVAVMLPLVSELKVAVTALNRVVKKLLVFTVPAVRLEIVVVARVVVPATNKLPPVEALPFVATLKLVFSTHDDPFQYSVELVATPSAKVPPTVVQNVDVPFVARNCPILPVALFVSRSSPVIRRLVIVDDASVARPETFKLPVLILLEVSAVAVVVASTVVPVAVRDPVVNEPDVRVPNTALTALNTVVKKLVALSVVAVSVVAVAFVTLRFDIVVVARVVVPNTLRFPLVVALPFVATLKFSFSTQPLPFQYNVEFVAVPPEIVPLTFVQNVDVPFVANTCPSVPVAPFESLSKPVSCRLAIVVDASTARFVTLRLVVVAFVVTELVAVVVPKVAFVAVKLVKNALSADKTVEKKLVDVPLVKLRLVIVVFESVEVPSTVRVPEAIVLPRASTAKFTFCVHAEPFQ